MEKLPGPVQQTREGEVLDLLMMALVAAAFVGGAAYVGFCARLGRRPDAPDEDRQ